MEFLDYLRLVRRHWTIVMGLGIVGLLLGGLSVAVATPTYRATAEMFVGTDLSQRLDLSASQFTLDRMESYAALVNSPEVTEGVADELGLDLSGEEVGSMISADVIPGTVLIRLDVEDISAQRTSSIANAAARRLGEVIQELEAPEGGPSPLRVSLTRPATPPSAPASPDPQVRLGLGLVLGLGLGLVMVSLREQAARSAPPVVPSVAVSARS